MPALLGSVTRGPARAVPRGARRVRGRIPRRPLRRAVRRTTTAPPRRATSDAAPSPARRPGPPPPGRPRGGAIGRTARAERRSQAVARRQLGGDGAAGSPSLPRSIYPARAAYSADDADRAPARRPPQSWAARCSTHRPPTPTDSTAAPPHHPPRRRPSRVKPLRRARRRSGAVEQLPGSGRGHHRTASGGRGGGGRGHQRTPSDTKRISAIDAASTDAPSSYAELALRTTASRLWAASQAAHLG